MTKPLWAEPAAPTRTSIDGWAELVRLVPADVSLVPQHAALGESGDWYLTQGKDSGHPFQDLTITRFDPSGRRLGAMLVVEGGHGDRLVMRGDDVGVYIQGFWCWLPWTRGRTWRTGDTIRHRSNRRRLSLPARAWCQGEVDLGDTWLRLYGVPFKPEGPSRNPRGLRNPNIPAFIEVIENLRVVRTIKLGHLAREKNGQPIGGRLEPEGLAQGRVDGQPWILAGFAIGRIGNTHLVVYGRPTRLILDD